LPGHDRGLWDCVIARELLHFSVPNHGKLQKCLMRAPLGDWEMKESRLRKVSTLASTDSASEIVS